MGFFKKLFSKEKKEKLDTGLQKTKEGVWSKITRAVAGKSKVDDDVLDNLEEAFITSDVGLGQEWKCESGRREHMGKFVGCKERNCATLGNYLCSGWSGSSPDDRTQYIHAVYE